MDRDKAIGAMRDFLTALDIDLAESHMEKTPERVTDMYAMLFDGCGKSSAVWRDISYAGRRPGRCASSSVLFDVRASSCAVFW